MARELRRLLISPERLRAAGDGGEQRLAITDPEAHYLRRVLRLASGDAVAVVDGRGQLWTAALCPEGGLLLDQPLAEPLQRCAPLTPQIGLAMAVPRRDGELVWRMATEIGVDHLQPLMAERTQGRQAWPLERWSTILQEAAEQCERLWLPRLEPPLRALELLAEPPTGLGLIATTRRPGLPLLEEVLAAGSKAPEALGAAGASTERKAQWLLQSVTLAIGPEGGWSDQELATAEDSGWLAVSLGEPILRTATAAIAGVSRLASWRALSCASSPSPSP
jgi:16S rRNA (uracil1498-N3)-methyltransferase